ncbi:MAG: sulfite exporter TauE/SafE family protein [Phycisphaerales bacterium]|nr:MAG: sulfite exporter TauE/SafE family protein [Phycisphaerales bacterium]
MLALTAIALALVALLYASVGHGGASGYLAVLAITGQPPETVRATALSLNIVVASIALARFARRSGLRLDLLIPFAAAAVPCAFIAGRFWSLDEQAYRVAIALVLLFAAWRLAISPKDTGESPRKPPSLPVALAIGSAIGLISGLIGVGGGIFLSPVLILFRWATAKQAAGVAAAFVVLSSIAGLSGLGLQLGTLPVHAGELGLFAACVAVGGFIGAELGSGRFETRLLRRALSVVLVIAALKLVLA